MRIAIVKLSALGDIVHAMVVLQFIKKFNQEISIDWFVEECYKELLEFNPQINKVHSVNILRAKEKKSIFILIKELMKLRKLSSYDLVIDMQGLIKSAIISQLIPSKHTLGFDEESVREKLASKFYNKHFKYNYHDNVIERNFEIVKSAIGFPSSKNELLFKKPFLYAAAKYNAELLLNSKKNILIIPGASNKSKCFPVDKFAEVINTIDENFIIVWGSKNELVLAQQIKALAPKSKVSDNLSLDSLISLISQVDLVIGSDTGPTHMAWALNRPSITLYGSTPGKRNSLITDKNIIIESSSKVDPYKINKKDYSIRNIKVDDIVKMTYSQLNH